ncbi:unnamed protein product [Protopolystoma xenopodis]|uniref:Uncharacterized protein n=1 Tax=Protopolystoma xenopodis TaxID=117903 RepID=A0A448XAZ3_9PLAT|nr:unnamed protein product [Protopolystoma xenopodis]
MFELDSDNCNSSNKELVRSELPGTQPSLLEGGFHWTGGEQHTPETPTPIDATTSLVGKYDNNSKNGSYNGSNNLRLILESLGANDPGLRVAWSVSSPIQPQTNSLWQRAEDDRISGQVNGSQSWGIGTASEGTAKSISVAQKPGGSNEELDGHESRISCLARLDSCLQQPRCGKALQQFRMMCTFRSCEQFL